jgi:hypothetical protein
MPSPLISRSVRKVVFNDTSNVVPDGIVASLGSFDLDARVLELVVFDGSAAFVFPTEDWQPNRLIAARRGRIIPEVNFLNNRLVSELTPGALALQKSVNVSFFMTASAPARPIILSLSFAE